MSSPGAPLQRTIPVPFVPLESAAPRNAAEPFNAAADAAGAAAAAATHLQEVRQKVADQHALNQARIAGQQQLDDLKLQFAQDPDPATAPERFQAEARKVGNTLAGGLQGTELQNNFADEFGSIAESARVEVKALSIRRQSDEAIATVDRGLEQSQRSMAAAKSVAERTAIAAQASNMVSGAMNSGLMNKRQAQTRIQTWREGVAGYDAVNAILADPAKALTSLRAGDFPDLDPLKRLQLEEQADAKIRQDEREARMALTSQKVEARANLADAQVQLAQGLPVDPASLDGVRAVVQASGDPMLANRYDMVATQAAMQQKLRGASPVEVDRTIDALQSHAGGAMAPLDEAAAQKFVLAQFPGAVITSGYRTPQQNKAADGTDNSYHTRGKGQALDVVIKGMTLEEAHARFATALKTAGLPIAELLVEHKGDVHSTGDHIHWAWGDTPVSVEGPKIAAALQAARLFKSHQQQGLNNDPLTWAAGQGVVQLHPLTLNGSDPPQAWSDRIKSAESVATLYGRQPVYLTGGEVSQLKDALHIAQPAAKLKVAMDLIGGLGNRAISAFAQIAPHDPVLGQAGALALSGKRNAAADALIGQQVLSAKGSQMAPVLAARNSQAPAVRSAFRLAPEMSGHVMAAADAIYAKRASEAGLTGADAEDAGAPLYARAVQEAAGAGYDADGTQYGGLVPFRGRAVAVPATIKADDFEPIVKGLSPQQLQRGSLFGGAPVREDGAKFEDGLGNAWLISVGEGRYAVSTTDPSGEVHLLHDPKAPPHSPAYVLDLAKVLPWLSPAPPKKKVAAK